MGGLFFPVMLYEEKKRPDQKYGKFIHWTKVVLTFNDESFILESNTARFSSIVCFLMGEVLKMNYFYCLN